MLWYFFKPLFWFVDHIIDFYNVYKKRRILFLDAIPSVKTFILRWKCRYPQDTWIKLKWIKASIFPGVRQDYKLLAEASDCVTTGMPNILTAQRNASSLLERMFSALFFFPGPPCCAFEATFILSVSQIAVLMRESFLLFYFFFL